jgi:ATP-dependent Lon protease
MKRHQSTGYQRYSGAKAGSDQASPYGGVSESKKRRTPKNVQRVSESKIMKEYKELKSKNEEYKGALKVFKNKLNEVALFNTNLAYVNRLFTEHSTTKSEKMEILKRFDNAESIKESKSIYKSVKSELDTKSPITESVENKVNKTVKSSKSDLNESTAYVDPQITAIKDLMRKLS